MQKEITNRSESPAYFSDNKIQYSATEFKHLKQMLLTLLKCKSFFPGSGRQQTEIRIKNKSEITKLRLPAAILTLSSVSVMRKRS